MQKLTESNQPVMARVISATPRQLREIADRLDAAVLSGTAGEQVIYQATSGMVFYFDPKEAILK